VRPVNHAAVYSRIVERARSRVLLGYCESHHVLPRCMGGGDEPSNLVDLTPEEHYVCHLLLVRIYPNVQKLVFAAWAMLHGHSEIRRRGNKAYGWLRKLHSERMREAKTGVPLSDDHKRAISDATRAYWQSPEGRKNKAAGSAKRIGTKRDPSTGAKISAALTGKKAATLECPHCHKVGGSQNMQRYHFDRCYLVAPTEWRKRGPISEETRARMSASKRGAPKPRATCPHCGVEQSAGALKRFHLDKCKEAHHGP
jgi:hypothetical protein